MIVSVAAAGGLLFRTGRLPAGLSTGRTTLERGQCTWYAFQRAHEAGWDIRFDQPWGRHARAWWEKVTNCARGVEPRQGAIMVLDAWPGNPYGHVAYVESVQGPDRWTVTHANLGLGGVVRSLDGVPIYQAECVRAVGGVRVAGNRFSPRLRGFLYPHA